MINETLKPISYFVFYRHGQGSAVSGWYGGREFNNYTEASAYRQELKNQSANGWYSEVRIFTEQEIEEIEADYDKWNIQVLFTDCNSNKWIQ